MTGRKQKYIKYFIADLMYYLKNVLMDNWKKCNERLQRKKNIVHSKLDIFILRKILLTKNGGV